jgi:hypothetical protein
MPALSGDSAGFLETEGKSKQGVVSAAALGDAAGGDQRNDIKRNRHLTDIIFENR